MSRLVEALIEVAPGVVKPQLVDLDNAGGIQPQTTAGIGSVPAASATAGVTIKEYGDGLLHKTVFTLTAVSVDMTDATTAGCHGKIQLYDFPDGLVDVLGATTNVTLLAGAGGIADTAAVVAGLGTGAVATDNGTLVGSGEADIVASTAATLTAGAGAFKGKTTVVVVLDGTGTAKDMYLNMAMVDAESSASDTLTLNGTVTLVWVSAGDF